MGVPQIRRFDIDISDGPMTDAETGLTSILLTKPNVILDVVNISRGASDSPTVRIIKNGADTGRRLYGVAMDATTAGRQSVGPIALGPGLYQFYCEHSGTAAAYAIAVKFGDTIQ